MKLFTASEMNHTPHILASVFLCGLWLPIWFILTVTESYTYHCNNCGYSAKTKYLRDPNLYQQEIDNKVRNAAKRAKIYQKINDYPYLFHIGAGFFIFCLVTLLLVYLLKTKIPPPEPIQTTAPMATAYPEPTTPAQLLERAKMVTGASHSPTAYRWLKQIPKNANEYPEAPKMIKAEDEKLKRENLNKR